MSDNTNDKAAEAAQEPKNIPPANLPEELLPVYDWYMGKGKDQLLVAAIALVVAVVAFSIFKYRDGQNAEASFALTGAEGVESLEGLNTKYGRTAVAPVIALRLARAYFDAGDYDKAVDTYGAFAKKNRKEEEAPQRSKITPMRASKKSKADYSDREIMMFRPTSDGEVSEIMDALLADRTVVLNLEGINETLAEKIIYTISGASYALSGSMLKISNYIFIIAPKSVELSGDGSDEEMNRSASSGSRAYEFAKVAGGRF